MEARWERSPKVEREIQRAGPQVRSQISMGGCSPKSLKTFISASLTSSGQRENLRGTRTCHGKVHGYTVHSRFVDSYLSGASVHWSMTLVCASASTSTVL